MTLRSSLTLGYAALLVILLTSRDFTTGFSPTPAGLAIRPFDDATGSATFLELVGQTDPLQTNVHS